MKYAIFGFFVLAVSFYNASAMPDGLGYALLGSIVGSAMLITDPLYSLIDALMESEDDV